MPLTLDDLRPNPGAKTNGKRLGRGHGSGRGKTAGRGTKGQKARSGSAKGRGFEGGQLPIQQRLPYKRGFTNIYKTPWEVVNLDRLVDLEVDGAITPDVLFERGVTRGIEFPVKILGRGDLAKAIEIHAHAFSGSAQQQIEAAGGRVETLERTDRWVTARPRSRRLPLSKEMKRAGAGTRGGPSRSEAARLGAASEA